MSFGGPWTWESQVLSGDSGVPFLIGAGPLVPGTKTTLRLGGAASSAPVALVLGGAALNAPFLGGVLVPEPTLVVNDVTDEAGERIWTARWPADIPSGSTLHTQAWIADSGTPMGWSASNGVAATAP